MKSLLLLLTVSSFLISCSQLQRRGEGASREAETSTSTVLEVDEEFQGLPSQISNQSPKKVGLILGSGGARTLAYAGLIRSFVKNKITISHIASTEWSSLVAASFALSGEVHDMDWKLYKLESLGLKFDKGFLGFGGSQSSSILSKYLRENFQGQRLENSKVSFACATRGLDAHQSVILSKGLAHQVLQRCLPSPAFYKNLSQASSPASLLKLAADLKKNGAEIIVFVNVLDGRILSEPLINADSNVKYSWGQVLEGHDAVRLFIRNSFSLNLNKYSIFDFSQRKALETEGERQGDQIAQSLIRAYRL